MEIYCLPLADDVWGAAEDALLPHVSAGRQNKIRAFRSPAVKKLSLYAALLARIGLSRATGLPADSLRFGETPLHKPVLMDAPEIDFSISHTEGFALCAVCAGKPVGADAERVRRAPGAVMRRAFCAQEIRYVNSPDFSDTRFFEIWTKKEAYTKCTGTGLATELTNINTLAPELLQNFYTFSCENCLCAVYSESAADAAPLFLSRQKILDFFAVNSPL